MRRSQLIGKHGETIARSTLSGLGIEIFGKIETPKELHRVPHADRVVFEVHYTGKASSDFCGALPNGQAVFAEVKTKTGTEDRLCWSDFKSHQINNLQRYSGMNILALVVWVNEPRVYVMRWPIEDFAPGRSIALPEAAAHHDNTVAHIHKLLAQIDRQMSQMVMGGVGWR